MYQPIHFVQTGGHPGWVSREEQDSSLAKKSPQAVPILCEPKDATDSSPTRGLSLLQLLLSCCFALLCRELGGFWDFLSLPLCCEKLTPHKLRRRPPRCQHRKLIFFPFPERHTVHLQQAGCPLGTTAVFISQQTPYVVRVWVYPNLDFKNVFSITNYSVMTPSSLFIFLHNIYFIYYFQEFPKYFLFNVQLLIPPNKFLIIMV